MGKLGLFKKKSTASLSESRSATSEERSRTPPPVLPPITFRTNQPSNSGIGSRVSGELNVSRNLNSTGRLRPRADTTPVGTTAPSTMLATQSSLLDEILGDLSPLSMGPTSPMQFGSAANSPSMSDRHAVMSGSKSTPVSPRTAQRPPARMPAMLNGRLLPGCSDEDSDEEDQAADVDDDDDDEAVGRNYPKPAAFKKPVNSGNAPLSQAPLARTAQSSKKDNRLSCMIGFEEDIAAILSGADSLLISDQSTSATKTTSKSKSSAKRSKSKKTGGEFIDIYRRAATNPEPPRTSTYSSSAANSSSPRSTITTVYASSARQPKPGKTDKRASWLKQSENAARARAATFAAGRFSNEADRFGSGDRRYSHDRDEVANESEEDEDSTSSSDYSSSSSGSDGEERGNSDAESNASVSSGGAGLNRIGQIAVARGLARQAEREKTSRIHNWAGSVDKADKSDLTIERMKDRHRQEMGAVSALPPPTSPVPPMSRSPMPRHMALAHNDHMRSDSASTVGTVNEIPGGGSGLAGNHMGDRRANAHKHSQSAMNSGLGGAQYPGEMINAAGNAWMNPAGAQPSFAYPGQHALPQLVTSLAQPPTSPITRVIPASPVLADSSALSTPTATTSVTQSSVASSVASSSVSTPSASVTELPRKSGASRLRQVSSSSEEDNGQEDDEDDDSDDGEQAAVKPSPAAASKAAAKRSVYNKRAERQSISSGSNKSSNAAPEQDDDQPLQQMPPPRNFADMHRPGATPPLSATFTPRDQHIPLMSLGHSGQPVAAAHPVSPVMPPTPTMMMAPTPYNYPGGMPMQQMVQPQQMMYAQAPASSMTLLQQQQHMVMVKQQQQQMQQMQQSFANNPAWSPNHRTGNNVGGGHRSHGSLQTGSLGRAAPLLMNAGSPTGNVFPAAASPTPTRVVQPAGTLRVGQPTLLQQQQMMASQHGAATNATRTPLRSPVSPMGSAGHSMSTTPDPYYQQQQQSAMYQPAPHAAFNAAGHHHFHQQQQQQQQQHLASPGMPRQQPLISGFSQPSMPGQ